MPGPEYQAYDVYKAQKTKVGRGRLFAVLGILAIGGVVALSLRPLSFAIRSPLYDVADRLEQVKSVGFHVAYVDIDGTPNFTYDEGYDAFTRLLSFADGQLKIWESGPHTLVKDLDHVYMFPAQGAKMVGIKDRLLKFLRRGADAHIVPSKVGDMQEFVLGDRALRFREDHGALTSATFLTQGPLGLVPRMIISVESRKANTSVGMETGKAIEPAPPQYENRHGQNILASWVNPQGDIYLELKGKAGQPIRVTNDQGTTFSVMAVREGDGHFTAMAAAVDGSKPKFPMKVTVHLQGAFIRDNRVFRVPRNFDLSFTKPTTALVPIDVLNSLAGKGVTYDESTIWRHLMLKSELEGMEFGQRYYGKNNQLLRPGDDNRFAFRKSEDLTKSIRGYNKVAGMQEMGFPFIYERIEDIYYNLYAMYKEQDDKRASRLSLQRASWWMDKTDWVSNSDAYIRQGLSQEGISPPQY